MSELDKDQVNDFFSKAAILHRNENAVLDVAEGQEHSNIYRNYFTANYILQNLQLKSNRNNSRFRLWGWSCFKFNC